MILIIAEKAIAGRRIAGILAGERHSEKASAGAIYFDFEQRGQQYSVVPLRGHIVDVDFPAKYMQWLGTDLRKLAESEIEYIETEKTIAGFLRRIAPLVEEAIVATDDDREGESIGLEAIEILHSVNKKIPVKRMRFSAIIEQEIKPAFSALQQLDTNLAESANARREIDLVWGAVLTRFLSLISGQLGKQFLSMGRVQGPSVDFDDEILIRDNNEQIALTKIGDFVEGQKCGEPTAIGDCEVFDIRCKRFEALSFNKNSLKTEFKPITNVVKHRFLGNLLQITLESGRKARITGSHSIFTLRDGNIQVAFGEDLKEGDLVLAPKLFSIGNCCECIDLLKFALNAPLAIKQKLFISDAFLKKWVFISAQGAKWLKARRGQLGIIIHKTRFPSSTVSQWENGVKKKASYSRFSAYLAFLGSDIDFFLQNNFGELVVPKRKVVKASLVKDKNILCIGSNSKLYSFDEHWALPINFRLNSDFMRLLGYYLAEGSCGRMASLDFGLMEKDLALDAVNCIHSVFGRIPAIRAKKSVLHINFFGTLGKIVLQDFFAIGKNAKAKRLPAFVFNAPNALQIDFLKGYFEGDGSFSSSGQLEATTASNGLASDLLYLFNQFGVIASVQKSITSSPLPNQKKPCSRIRYRVKISGKSNLQKLRGAVPWRWHGRFEKYMQLNETRCGYDGIPIHESGLAEIWRKLPHCFAQRISPNALLKKVQNTNKPISATMLQSISNLAQTDLCFLRIKKIEQVPPSREFVYDISVQDNENFVGGFGGIILHNTLALLVDREKERMAFESKKYWIVQALFEKDKQQFIALHKKGRFWGKGEAEKAAGCRAAKSGTVQQVRKTKKVLSRPVPFNTTLFLRAATAIGFSAGRAMQIAETLYQQGLTSYPRTDNSVYPAALDLRAILNQLATVQQFAPLAGQLLKQKKLEASRGAFAKDHPPIHPVAAAPAGRLGSDEWRIYELICRRFMATLAANALTENLAVEIELAKEIFVANGQRYLSKGWKIFYPYSKAEETILPVLQKGDEVLLVKLDMLLKETMPPARYSQGALIKAMSELGLGTKSTRAEIIQKLYARKYIAGQKAIEPNKIAFAVIDSLEKYDGVVVKPKMTADLEKEMDTVAEGKKEKKAVVDESRQFLSNALQQLLLNKNEIGSMLRGALRADAIIGKCTKPECDGELLIRHGRTGKRFLGCSAYPKCTNTFPLPQKGSITVLQKRCGACGNFMVQVGGRRYRFSMCIDPNCKSKDEWKKKREEKIRAQEEKEATEKAAEKKAGEEAAEKKAAEKGAEKKVIEEGKVVGESAEKKVVEKVAGKIKELKALPKKKKAKGSKLKETEQGTEKKKKSRNLKPRAQAPVFKNASRTKSIIELIKRDAGKD